MNAETQGSDAISFVVNEGALLNEGRYEQWLALFAPDGHYWVPLEGDRQHEPVAQVSLAYEDRLLLATRIRRLAGLRAHSLEPGVRGLHVLQQPVVVVGESPNEVLVRTPFIYTELCGERQLQLAGVWRHRLRETAEGFRIVLKRVDLLNAMAPHEAIQLFP